MLEKRKCPVCNSLNNEDVYQQNFIDIPGVDIEKFEQHVAICKDCGMVFVSPFLDDEHLTKYYSCMSAYEYGENNYEYPKSHKKRSNRQFDYLESFIKKGDSTLDIGSAIGYFVSLFQDNGYDAIGVEPSPLNKKIAKEKYDVDTISGVFTNELLGGKLYDLITLSHVAEHLKTPEFIFREIYKSLNDDGLLFIEVPDMDLFDEKDMYQFFFEHINFFNTKSLSNLMKNVGFDLVDEIIFENNDRTAPFAPTKGTLWRKQTEVEEIGYFNYYENNKEIINKYIMLLVKENNFLNSKVNEIINKYNNIAIWAGGTLTAQLLAQTNLLNSNIINIFDNDPKKTGTKMANILIEKPEKNIDYFQSKNIDAIIIGSWSSQEEIYESLQFLDDDGIKVIKLFDKVDDA